jgi:hypothetical protein
MIARTSSSFCRHRIAAPTIALPIGAADARAVPSSLLRRWMLRVATVFRPDRSGPTRTYLS